MSIDRDAVPCYVIVLDDGDAFALNQHRKLLPKKPSAALIEHAKTNFRAFIPINVTAWDEFARTIGLDPSHRDQRCCYILVNWNETDEQLQALLDLYR
ncbi:hypothetical protein SB379_06895 [Burkholderia multivorans]|uniref:hypothetical protein n=1 Tax=Burkholderia multivorans TaxID=87883 RepID=UPI000D3D972D|nr:hypothetical protein [Burkholderia multivorans]MBR8020185.1 hypothetical protein [Burkholderia multivorans]MEB2511593.1 hypothetical protein [Burkholderia multivorans]MEB2521203.1 hypothetical protein [Burkholderia multivorans]MEB2573382.1 hypothetical protein [Burkholderia multivorans]MEB2590542.1 hypothetical protein [Burkholderia multivorans]